MIILSGNIKVKEYELTGRPKYIDMVMIKTKNEDKDIANEGGFASIFSGHNVIDYKGVGDRLDIYTKSQTGETVLSAKK